MHRATIALTGVFFAAALGCDGGTRPTPATAYAYPAPYAEPATIDAVAPYVTTPTTLVTVPPSESLGAFFFDGTTATYAEVAPASYLATTAVTSLLSLPVVGGTATTLATGPDAVTGIAVDSDGVYFIDVVGAASYPVSFIGKVPLTGGAVVELAANLTVQPVALAVSGGNVYWTDAGGAINRVSTAGGDVAVLATGQGHLFNIAADASGVYWTTGQTTIDCGTTGGSIGALLVGSAAPTTLASSFDNLGSLLVSGGSVYFTFWGPSCNRLPTQGKVVRLNPGSSVQTSLATGLTEPSNLFVSGNYVYYTTTNTDLTLTPRTVLQGVGL
jgi:hypothetical protein